MESLDGKSMKDKGICVFGFEGIPQCYFWLHGQAVKTSPFHGGNTGSIPVGVIMA